MSKHKLIGMCQHTGYHISWALVIFVGLPDCKHLQQVQGVLQWQFQAFKNSHRNEHFPTLVMNRAVQAAKYTIKHGKSYRRSRLSLVIWVPTKVLLQLHAANEPSQNLNARLSPSFGFPFPLKNKTLWIAQPSPTMSPRRAVKFLLANRRVQT